METVRFIVTILLDKFSCTAYLQNQILFTYLNNANLMSRKFQTQHLQKPSQIPFPNLHNPRLKRINLPNANPNLFPTPPSSASGSATAVTPTTRNTDRAGIKHAATRSVCTRRPLTRSSSELTSHSQDASFVSARGCSKNWSSGPSRRIVVRKERRDFIARFSIMDWPVLRIVRCKYFADVRFLASKSTLST